MVPGLPTARPAVIASIGVAAAFARTAEYAGLAYVDVDIREAIAHSVNHFADLGHRQIVFLHQDDPEFGHLLVLGGITAAHKLGLEFGEGLRGFCHGVRCRWDQEAKADPAWRGIFKLVIYF